MSYINSWYSRRELLWPELDQLLRDEDDAATVSTPYTAAVLEYRVVYYDPEDASLQDKIWGSANGHTVHDAQHPCRYQESCALPLSSWFFLVSVIWNDWHCCMKNKCGCEKGAPYPCFGSFLYPSGIWHIGHCTYVSCFAESFQFECVIVTGMVTTFFCLLKTKMNSWTCVYPWSCWPQIRDRRSCWCLLWESNWNSGGGWKVVRCFTRCLLFHPYW